MSKTVLTSPQRVSQNHDEKAPSSPEDGGISLSQALAGRPPTDEEKTTLRLVSGKIPWPAYAIALVEFAERASYYGCSGVFNNFIQRPLPAGGNGAGAPPPGTQLTAGALGKGLVVATALTTTFSFLAFTVPILGGILADTKWGRYKTICVGTFIALIAHILLLVAGIPALIQQDRALGPFIAGLLTLAFSTGLIKASVAPLMADQVVDKVQHVETLASGEKVIVDPSITVERVLMIYYWCINVGAFIKLGTVYAEKQIGFWAAYLIPLIIFMIMPLVLAFLYNKLYQTKPQGSVVLDVVKVFRTILSRGGVSGACKGGDNFWDSAKPTNIAATGGLKGKSATWIKWDDTFVDEVRRGFYACRLFIFLPIFYVADGGLGTIQNSMAGAMTTDGAPNDLLANFNPLTLIVLTPCLNYFLYPWMRKHGYQFRPIRRIVTGFVLAALAMAIGAILQWRVYETSPCGYEATKCDIGTTVSPLTVWAQLPLYVLPATAELLVSVTCYELAYTHAPEKLKGLVFALVLLMNAFSSALVLIVSPSFKDPNLIWPFVGVSIATLIAGGAIWILFRDMDNDVIELVVPDRAVEVVEEKK